eukprot:36150-Eustigmatos_ZCMA.PRE.1
MVKVHVLRWCGRPGQFGGLGDSLKLFGHTADRVSVISQSLADQEELHLEEPFLEYCRMVTAVKDALQKRHEVRTLDTHTSAGL